MYLKSVDKNYRRYYEKFVGEKSKKGDHEHIQKLYVSNRNYFLISIFDFISIIE
jgi:hypothetical protein